MHYYQDAKGHMYLIQPEDVMLLAGMVFTYFFNRKTENQA
jgi:hypothetical protein